MVATAKPGSDSALYDVLVAGGGMVGASLGCALSGCGLRVAIVEPYPVSSDQQPSFDERTTALSRSSQRILQTLELWGALGDSVQAIDAIHVSEQGRFGTAVIDARQQGVEALGYVVQNRKLGKILWDRLSTSPDVTIRSPEKIVSVSVDGAEVVATTERDGQGSQLTARLLVVSDGARSAVRQALGIGAREREYAQAAIVGNIAVDPEYCAPIAFERFTPQGPIAMLPMHDNRYTFVLTRTQASADDVLALDDDAFTELLQREFGHRLGFFSEVGKRYAYPLSLVQSEEIAASRAVIVGNAAHSLHPVAGQGFNLGLRDVAALAELLVAAARQPESDSGAADLLNEYVEWRATDQRNVVAFTDGLVRLFGFGPPALGAVRGLGVALFDAMPVAKRVLAHYTMGLSGRLSRLARGLDL